MEEDLGDGLGVGEEGDEGEGKGLVDAGPPGGYPEPREAGSVRGSVWVLEFPVLGVPEYGETPHNPRFYTGFSRMSALDRPDF